MTSRICLTVAAALAAMLSIAPKMQAQTTTATNAQLAELYKLQAAFHRATTVHDPVNGDSQDVIDQRIKSMLSLFTVNATLAPIVGFDANGKAIYNRYIGRGDLDTNCPAPSSDLNNRGTICSFFKYVSGSFQPGNRFIELGPSYKTNFDIHGNTASVYFECWYFDASNSTRDTPILTLKAHLTAQGTATKVDGAWLFSLIGGPPAGLPRP